MPENHATTGNIANMEAPSIENILKTVRKFRLTAKPTIEHIVTTTEILDEIREQADERDLSRGADLISGPLRTLSGIPIEAFDTPEEAEARAVKLAARRIRTALVTAGDPIKQPPADWPDYSPGTIKWTV